MISLIENHNMELLWENPDTSVGFSPQTINLDLSGYREVWVLYTHYTYSSSSSNPIFKLSKLLKGYPVECTIPATTNRSVPNRKCELSDTGVTFSDGSGFDDSFTYVSSNHSWVMPVKIYGVK